MIAVDREVVQQAVCDIVPEYKHSQLLVYDCRELEAAVETGHNGFCTENMKAIVQHEMFPNTLKPATDRLISLLQMTQQSADICFVFYCKSGHFRSLAMASIVYKILMSLTETVCPLPFRILSDTLPGKPDCAKCKVDLCSDACPIRALVLDGFAARFKLDL